MQKEKGSEALRVIAPHPAEHGHGHADRLERPRTSPHAAVKCLECENVVGVGEARHALRGAVGPEKVVKQQSGCGVCE